MNLCCEFVFDKYSWCHDARFLLSSIFIASSISRTFLAKTTISWRLFFVSIEFRRRMLMIKNKIFTVFQKKSFCKHILTMIFRDFLKTTERHCLKFSQKHTIFFSKKTVSSTSQKSEKIRLTIMKFHFRCIEISSQKINLTILISSTRSIFFLIEQMFSFFEFKRILNLKWAIISFFRSVIAMPEKIIAKTITFFDRSLIMTMFWTKIFFVFSKPSKKKRWSWFHEFLFFSTVSTIVLIACNWFALNLFQFATTRTEKSINVIFSRIKRFLIWTYWSKSIENSNKL